MLNRLKQLGRRLREVVITSKEKAVVAFLVTAVSSYCQQNGLTWHDLLTWSAVRALALGVLAHLLVYLTTNTELGE